jgi:hypothetical protein
VWTRHYCHVCNDVAPEFRPNMLDVAMLCKMRPGWQRFQQENVSVTSQRKSLHWINPMVMFSTCIKRIRRVHCYFVRWPVKSTRLIPEDSVLYSNCGPMDGDTNPTVMYFIIMGRQPLPTESRYKWNMRELRNKNGWKTVWGILHWTGIKTKRARQSLVFSSLILSNQIHRRIHVFAHLWNK